jgi:hypothetical protein
MNTRALVLISLVIGLALGLGYAWLIDPVTFSESSPAQVTQAYRKAWLLMAAEAYAQDGDWERTQIRIEALRDPNIAQTLATTFDQVNAAGPNAEARALARLADRLSVSTPGMLIYLAGIITPTPLPSSTPRASVTPRASATPRPTGTPLPTATIAATPTQTPIPAYQVIDRRAECSRSAQPPQIRVIVRDALGHSAPGKEVWIMWEGGSDRFVTGLKPEIDPGYGDFDMQLDQTYNISIDKQTSVVVRELRAEPCETDGRTSWRLILGPRTP